MSCLLRLGIRKRVSHNRFHDFSMFWHFFVNLTYTKVLFSVRSMLLNGVRRYTIILHLLIATKTRLQEMYFSFKTYSFQSKYIPFRIVTDLNLCSLVKRQWSHSGNNTTKNTIQKLKPESHLCKCVSCEIKFIVKK